MVKEPKQKTKQKSSIASDARFETTGCTIYENTVMYFTANALRSRLSRAIERTTILCL